MSPGPGAGMQIKAQDLFCLPQMAVHNLLQRLLRPGGVLSAIEEAIGVLILSGLYHPLDRRPAVALQRGSQQPIRFCPFTVLERVIACIVSVIRPRRAERNEIAVQVDIVFIHAPQMRRSPRVQQVYQHHGTLCR